MSEKITPEYSYEMRAYTVDVIRVDSDNGERWEFWIYDNGVEIHMSKNAYDNPYSAASEGFKWIVDSNT